MITSLLRRPRLLSAIAAGLAVGAGLAVFRVGADASTCAVIGWDITCLWFAILTLWAMRRADGQAIRQRAAQQDEGRHMILGLSVFAVIASMAGVAIEFMEAKKDGGGLEVVRILLAVGTVALSWLFCQLIFTVHYAHEFYGAPAKGKGVRGGLRFPGDNDPDYWDFFHFAAIIGVANQTADIAFTSRHMRRIGTLHGIVAFVFNTAVLALMINLAAGLLG